MDVTAQKNGVGDPGRRQGVEQPVPGDGVAVPAVRPEPLARDGLLVDVRRHRALGEECPLRLAAGELRRKLLLLTRTELAALRVEQFGAVIHAIGAAASRSWAGLRRAVLALVQHQQVDDSAERLGAIQPQIRSGRHRTPRKRNVLAMSLVGGRPARKSAGSSFSSDVSFA